MESDVALVQPAKIRSSKVPSRRPPAREDNLGALIRLRLLWPVNPKPGAKNATLSRPIPHYGCTIIRTAPASRSQNRDASSSKNAQGYRRGNRGRISPRSSAGERSLYTGEVQPDAHQSPFRSTRRVVALPSNFRRAAGSIEHRRVLDIIRRSTGGRIFGGAPQRFGRGVQPVNGLVSGTSGVVRSCRNLLGAIRAGTLLCHRFISLHEEKTARRSGPSLSVTYRCRSFGRAAVWDFCHPLREPGSAGPVSDRRPAAERASAPAIDSVGQAGFGSSCLLPFMGTPIQPPGVRLRSDKIKWSCLFRS